MIEKLAAASLRAKGRVQLNLVAQGPLGAKHVAFNATRVNSIQKVEQCVPYISQNNPAICSPSRIHITKEYYNQGHATQISDILRIVAPKLDPREVDILVSTEVDPQPDLYNPPNRLSYFITAQSEPGINTSRLADGYWMIRCHEDKLNDVLIAAQLSSIMLRCFPFTIIQSASDRENFFSSVKTAFTVAENDQDGSLLECTGLPTSFLPGFASTWLSVLNSEFGFSKTKLDASSAARFIVKSWAGQGGALSESSLVNLLNRCMTKLTNHRSSYLENTAISALEAILSKKAVLLASLSVPNDERQISLAALMQRPIFKRHTLCVLSAADMNSEEVRSYLQERCLEKFDASHLVSMSHLLTR